jgi:uncharacterized protein RhaS with RHS repeats
MPVSRKSDVDLLVCASFSRRVWRNENWSLTDGNGHTTTWQYDLQGRLVLKTAGDGAKTRYEYDSAGRQVL